MDDSYKLRILKIPVDCYLLKCMEIFTSIYLNYVKDACDEINVVSI